MERLIHRYNWVKHDMALTFSREIYRWPANLYEGTDVRFHGSQIFGESVRYGESLMRMSINIASPPPGRNQPREHAFDELAGGDFLQFRKFAAAEQGGRPIKQHLLILSQDFKNSEICSGDGALEFGKSCLYPNVNELDPQDVLDAWYVKASWTVPHPQLIWGA